MASDSRERGNVFDQFVDFEEEDHVTVQKQQAIQKKNV